MADVVDIPSLDRALIINDETNDNSGQIAPGIEALDGDGNTVITVVRATRGPLASDIRGYAQLWINTTTGALYWSRGGGLWYQFRDSLSIAAHEATHEAGGADALPWATIHGSGTLAARPAASAVNTGYLYDATDTQQLFRSSGAIWIEIGVSLVAKPYTHVQSVPALAWVVNHNLSRFPSAVSILDTTNRSILVTPQHNSINQLVVSFGRATAGSCLVR